MARRHRRWTDLLSGYLEGALGVDDLAAVETHLAECAECRSVLEELRDVVSQARTLGEVQPPRDLWPGIAAAIRAPVTGVTTAHGQVIALPTARDARAASGHPGVFLSMPQLAAAAAVLMVISVSATLWAGPGLAVRGEGTAPSSTPGVVATAVEAPAPPERIADELATLEATLEKVRAGLDPNTVRVLEKNLAVIENAIADSQRALALDPGNDFLFEHLERTYERKLAYLRDARSIVDWSG